MTDVLNLKAETREKHGKGPARALRREGKVPAVIYGPGGEPEMCALVFNDLKKVVGKRSFFNQLVELDFGGGRTVRVLPREAQFHPVTSDALHVDFYRAGEHATVIVEVPVVFLNDLASPGLKAGGTLNIVRRAIEVHAPADAIPDHLEVDLTGRDIGDSVHISQVTLPQGVKPTITDRDFTICSIVPPTVAKE
ncbi:MAG TPA: 50S ribosomal protein L25/general stress protein Ctc [Geminicoccus sp.]|jgi:large subunit ribosomal protein L25|uniref:50S ribosomal protein L25/general stress protein Ctc n=1 Tax=Geminicoccus sp. TaxID=2024832 RepID=UPI002E32853B|nr:50S ribosomal protein L25/general stress protein Ctc [Geminicoccus sp.]HEX2525368.1 50S ribosomal protein L25/general stress protein Ctc [Geminicoccus sp.]